MRLVTSPPPTKSATVSAALDVIGSATTEAKIAGAIGMNATIAAVYDTPTFWPHALQVVGKAGPRYIFRRTDIAGFPQ
jgi:hypothetical protein